MTEGEYTQRYLELRAKFDADVEVLMDEYLNSAFPHKVGDVIEGSFGKGKILNMDKSRYTYRNSGLPYYVVKLEVFKKDGTPMKRPRTILIESYNI